jgi:glutathione S-transferase
MSIRLYGNWFSPFARKVALALELKGLAYEPIDALTLAAHDELVRVNPRAEVPALVDDGLTVVNSSDIVQYLDWRYPQPALYPAGIADKVAARALERLADVRLDAILVDCSYWRWAKRDDEPPAGLMAAAQRDLEILFGRIEATIVPRPKPWPFGAPGMAECAIFPHLIAVRPLGFTLDAAWFPATAGWLEAMRAHPAFMRDVQRAGAFVRESRRSESHERLRLAWRGDRIEWLLARGFHDWLFGEIAAGRAFFPD